MRGISSAGRGAGALLCAVLVPASLALAGYQPGAYTGQTDQMVELGFRAGDAKVRQLATEVYAECGDGTRQEIAIERGRAEIDDDRFSLELTDKEVRATIAGKFRAERAWGRIEAVAKPPGTVCRADIRWQATLTKP